MRIIAAVLLCAVLSWTFPDAVPEARANGNVSADEPAPASVKKAVRKAPIRRPKRKASKAPQPQRPAAVKKKTPPQPPQPTSLERGIALMDAGRYGQAYPWLRKAVQEERRNPNAWYWYGLYHDTVGQYQQAQFFYVKALEQDPSFPPLSRVVTYPGDGGRKALWDPLRPARLYPVETGYRDIQTVPPGSPEAAVLPARPPVDPEAPKAPIYIPPEPFTMGPAGMGSAGEEASPPVYVPPPAEPESLE
ncbi:MAG: hypothetical protein LBL51_03590 [Synergistaceae bacterium]|jgi:hypothetical protein|nr:hypothetical protein [Synergistaceae bacterium]